MLAHKIDHRCQRACLQRLAAQIYPPHPLQEPNGVLAQRLSPSLRWRREPQHMTELRGTIVRFETRRQMGRVGSLSRPQHRSGDQLS